MTEAKQPALSRNQLIFFEVLVGFLVYVMVLGLFDAYTDLVSAQELFHHCVRVDRAGSADLCHFSVQGLVD